MLGPTLAIRADASHQGGTGHIMRTLAIAQEWITRGGTCVYISATLPDAIRLRVESENCEVKMLSSSPASSEDAKKTSSLLIELKARWLLIDGYSFTPEYQELLELPARTKLAVMSDFGCNDFYEPDLVIHSNIEATADYSKLADDNKAILLAGSDYVLLRKEIIEIQSKPTNSKVKNLLITMGGSDPREASFLACNQILKHSDHQNLNIKIVLGAAYPADGSMHSVEASNIELVYSPPSMGKLYEWADTAICSPSTTALELAYCGLPTGLIITADNQEKILQAMLEKKIAFQLSDARNEQPELRHLTDLLDSDQRIEMSNRSAKLIDGKGTKRICDAMRFPDIRLRLGTMEDSKDLHHWTNDPVTRAASFSSDPIPWDNHIAWLEKQLSAPDTTLLIIESCNEKLGVVRFNKNAETDGESIISISLDSECRSLGLAPLILAIAAEYFFAQEPQQVITAWIKPENIASIKTFIRANYKDYPSPTQPDQVRMRLTNTPSS